MVEKKNKGGRKPKKPTARQQDAFVVVEEIVTYDRLAEEGFHHRHESIKELSAVIIEEYNNEARSFFFKDTDADMHHQFVHRISSISQEHSECKISDKGEVVAPKGSIPSDKAKLKLVRLARMVDEIQEEINDIVTSDPLTAGLIGYCDKEGRIHDFVIALNNAHDVFSNASRVDIQKGVNLLPNWYNEAANLSKDFWNKQFGKESAPSFSSVDDGGGTKPENDFSRWFCVFDAQNRRRF